MPRDALCSSHTAGQQHADVSRGGQQHHGTHEEGHADGNSVLGTRSTAHDFYAVHPGEGAERQGNQEHNPIETTGFPVSPLCGQPSGSDEVEGFNPAADVIRLMPPDGKVHGEDGHGEHGCDEDFSRQDVARGTLAERDCGGPGQQSCGSGEDMTHQDGRIGDGEPEMNTRT